MDIAAGVAQRKPTSRKGEKGELKMEDSKHVCKVCNRRFSCGKALGGHMRIHGGQFNPAEVSVCPQKKKKRKVSEIGGSESVFQQAWHEEEKAGLPGPSSHSDLLRDIEGTSVSTSNSEQAIMHMHRDMDDLGSNPKMKGWLSKRSRHVIEQSLSTNQEEDVANCLVMLSTAEGSWRPPKTQLTESQNMLGYCNYVTGSRDLKNACQEADELDDSNPNEEADEWKICNNMFECPTCNKVFSSNRALGGHRASHKKIKDCRMEQEQVKNKVTEPFIDEVVSEESLSLHAIGTNKPKMHECPICHRNFGSGQALGGHKRSHWITSPSSSPSSSSPKQVQQEKEREKEKPILLDLNLPAPIEDDEVDGLKPCNLLNSMEAHNNISNYTQPWVTSSLIFIGHGCKWQPKLLNKQVNQLLQGF
ncbi:hypothetical protein SUGI_0331290 [Cryptomeria japonica]|nr:hypothetical protein SUGI_0331290 [Cryptomeria japonica]